MWSRTGRLAWATVHRLGRAELRALVLAAGRPGSPRDPRPFREELDRWAADALDALGVVVDLPGGWPERLPGPHLVVANHRAFVDIPLFLRLFGGRHLSRGDLAGWPVVGHAAQRIGTLFVDREDGGSGARAVRSLRRAFQGGDTVLVFPEGGTHAGDEVRPFRAGAFVAAKGLPVTVTPVGVAYPPGLDWSGMGFQAHLARVVEAPRVPVAVAVGRSRPLGDRPREAAVTLRDEVQELVDMARARLVASPQGD